MEAKKVESGVQLFSRVNQPTQNLNGINPKLFKEGPHWGDVIEVAGDFVIDLLIDFIIRCILPKELNTEWKGLEVVLVNTNHHISILKITKVIDSQLKHLNIDNRKQIVETALSKITILNCYNDQQLTVTFKCLEKIIRDRDTVSLLVVDDITSQYWIAKEKHVKLSIENYARSNLHILQCIVKNLNLVLIFSRSQIVGAGNLQVDYKLISERADINKIIVIDFIKNTSIIKQFSVQTFITYL